MTESRNIRWSESSVTPGDREHILGHRAATVWFTGLSGSGKSTLASACESALVGRGVNAYVLDGDNLRHGLSSDLGFSPTDRQENIRRAGEVCRLLHDVGLIVFTAFISPYRRDRDLVRRMHPPGGFVEVFVDAPIEVCEERDVKGLYARARSGEISDFSGVSAPYEEPTAPELRIETVGSSVATCVAEILTHLELAGVVSVG